MSIPIACVLVRFVRCSRCVWNEKKNAFERLLSEELRRNPKKAHKGMRGKDLFASPSNERRN